MTEGSLVARRARCTGRARRNAACAIPLVLASCAWLPASGPSANEVERRVQDDDGRPVANPLGIRLVALTPEVTRVLNASSAPAPSLRDLPTGRPSDRIGPGDVLAVAIYEAGIGLFADGRPGAAGEAPNTGAAAQVLPPLRVDGSGRIDVPYAGLIQVSGRTPLQVQRQIEAALAGRAAQAQAVVSVVGGETNTAFVSGYVRNPGRFPLGMSRERVLDLVTLAGGPTRPPDELRVRLDRRGRSASAPLAAIEPGGPDDVLAEPQDRVEVSFEPKTFLVMGATGKVAELPFDAFGLSLAQAVARSGGLDDQRADPRALFLFRSVPRATAEALGIASDPGTPASPDAPVIFRADMSDPQTLFLAQNVPMRDKDILFVANARATQLFKLLQLVNTVFAPAYYGKTVAQ